MNKLANLETEADAKRSRLESTLRRLEERASLLGVIDDVIIRTGAPMPGELAAALRRNPLLAAGLILCIGLLAIDVSRARKVRGVRGRARQSPVRAAAIADSTHRKEESYHGR